MANIANVRRFDGSDDYIAIADGALEASVEPVTFAVLYQPILADAAQNFLVGDTPFAYVFQQHEYNGLAFFNQEFSNAYSNSDDVVPGSGDWYLIAVTKGAGTATPRFHVRNITDAGAWSHYNAGNTVTAINTPSGSEFSIGGPGTESLNADIAVMGIWYGTALSDGDIETLDDNIAAWDTLNPTACWLFNQDSVATAVTDRTENGADQSSIVGTTVVTPTGLTFDVGSTVTLDVTRPDADVTTTGWTTTPLYSKINDSSDATVIQATAS